MVNGRWKMEKRQYSMVFSIYHLPFSIQADILQRPASADRAAAAAPDTRHGKWKMEDGKTPVFQWSFPFTIFHFPFRPTYFSGLLAPIEQP
jgi:hypothetical protein